MSALYKKSVRTNKAEKKSGKKKKGKKEKKKKKTALVEGGIKGFERERAEGPNILALHKLQDLPAMIPSSHPRAPAHPRLSLIQAFGAERVVLRQASQLVEQTVAVDVVGPGGFHGLQRVWGIEDGEDAFDTAELG